jgi:predicted dehydrogenase
MTIRIAMVGAGYIANIHAQAIQAQAGVELTALVELYDEKAIPFAERFKITRRYKTVEELLSGGGVDALVIGTPNALHAPQTLAALQAGMHVMVEKPMAMNSVEAQKMIAVSKQSGSRLMVAHCWRFDREVLWLKEQTGRLGRIIRTKGYGVHTHWGPVGWFTQKKLAGGGALADMGIHAIDTARFLLGDPLPVRVYAHIGTYYKNYDVDDTGVIMVHWDNGAVSYIESGWWQPHMDGPEAATQLYGLKGFGQVFPTRLEVPDQAKTGIELVDPGFSFPREEHCPQEMYNSQMAYFVNCVETGRYPVPGGDEGLVNIKIVDAAYESASSGKAVEV